MTQIKNQEQVNDKAGKVLQLSEEIRTDKIARRTIMRAYTEEIKRKEAELESILSDQPSNAELVKKDIHELSVIK